MKKKQAFTVGESTICPEGHYVLSNDSSLMYSFPAYGNFQLLLGNGYHMSLGVNKETGKCLTFYTLLDAITFEPRTIDLGKVCKASLFLKSDSLKMQEGDHYIPFVEKKYYDEENLILSFGDINVEGLLIEFSKDTYALINNARLCAIYIRVSENVIDYIKSKRKG